ncbi:MAG: hypothetical protein LBU37_04095 [Tannerellaceae bacterium]|jgi:hypothetical protein|nr:hypothetical protein [Tannerellaceae bacterium]
MEKKNQVAPGATSAGVNRQKVINSSSAIELLRRLYFEAKKELRRNEKVNTSVSANESNCSLTFITEDVNIQLIVKEGGVS